MWFSMVMVALALLAAPVSAQEDRLVIGLGTSVETESTTDVVPYRAVAAQLSYRDSDLLALELAYQQTGDLDLGIDFVAGVTSEGNLNGWLIGANARFYPRELRLYPYIRGGLGYVDLDSDLDLPALGFSAFYGEESLAIQIGAGFDALLTNGWALGLQGAYRVPRSGAGLPTVYTFNGYLYYEF